MKLGETPNLFQKGAPLFFLVFVAALTFIFRDAVGTMVQSWQKEEYSHGYLIPLLSLVLFLNKSTATELKPQAAWSGAIIVTLGILAQFGFQFANVNGILPEFYLISLIGLVALFWGTRALVIYAAPLALLFFCAPLPKLLFYTLSFDMQMMSSSLGTKFLMLLDIPVFQDGNVIDLGGYQLQVAEACSGIRYLFPLLGLSFLLASMYKTTFWKRALVFVSAVPITIFMNGLRIAIIGITVDQWGRAMAEGLLHEFEGWIVFAGCTALLMLEVTLLQTFGNKGRLNLDDLRIPSLKNVPLPALGKPTGFCTAILAVSLAVSIILPPFLQDYLKPIPLQQSLISFPLQLGSWIGHPGTINLKPDTILGTDEYFIADYTQDNSPPINLYMLYYPQQDSTSNQAVHSPAVCIPGGGWEILSQARQAVALKEHAPLTVNEMRISKGTTREIVYYWFVQDGNETPDPSTSRLYMLKNALTTGRTDGSLVRVLTTINEGESDQAAEQRLSDFLVEHHKTLIDYMFPK